MERQQFYLVMESEFGSKKPKKIFLQKPEAIRYGRRLATNNQKSPDRSKRDSIVELYKQDISRNGVVKFECSLFPFREGEEQS